MCIALSLHLNLAKFDQSRFHISMFRWLVLLGKGTGIGSRATEITKSYYAVAPGND
jgi:hypothetical protein